MATMKVTYTIDEAAIAFLKTKDNQSAFITDLIFKARDAQGGLTQKFEELMKERDAWELKMQVVTDAIIKIIEDGNRLQREQAQALQNQIDEKRQRKLDATLKLKEQCITFLHEIQQLDTFNSDAICALAVKMRDEGIGLKHAIIDKDKYLYMLKEKSEANASMSVADVPDFELWPLGTSDIRDLAFYLKTGEVRL